MLALDEIDMVVLGAPNDLHCEIAVDAAAAGKHVVCEKPLCLNLAEADRMIAACQQAKRQADVRRGAVLHAEVRPAQAARSTSGALGRPTLRQADARSTTARTRPHSGTSSAPAAA